MGKETLEEATMRYLAEENNNLVESTRETEITITKPISTYIEITDDREEWDYPIEDMDEARANNDYLIIDTTEPRVYEVTEDEFNLIKSKLEENVSMKVEAKTLTWNEIMDNAEGTTFGQKALKVKDTARDNIEKLLISDGVNIEELESVEDEIEDYCNKHNIKFDESGNVLTESKLVESKESVIEYTITFNNGELYDEYGGEYISEDKTETDELFNEIKEQDKLNQVSQYYAKTWVYSDEYEDYIEDDVEVYYYDKLNESRQVNNMKIKYSKLYNKYQVITPDGRVLEEFDTEDEAINWAKEQKDFLVKKESLNKKALVEKIEDTVEYVITFNDGELSDEYGGEFISEDKSDTDELFNELKSQHKLNQVHQYYAKTWRWDDSEGDYYEDDVDVYFNNGDERYMYEESKDEDTRFQANMTLHNAYGVDSGSKLISELDIALEQNNMRKIKRVVDKLKKDLSPNDYNSFIKTYYPEYKDLLDSIDNPSKKLEGFEEDVDLPEEFYEKICRAYIDTMNLEWVAEDDGNGTVVHGYFENDDYASKNKSKVNNDNFSDIFYGQFTDDYIEAEEPEYYSYQDWEEFYNEYVEDNIKYDLYDLGPDDFYISKEDLNKLGIDYSDLDEDYAELDESKSLTETIETNEEVINKTMNDVEYLDYLGITKEDVIKQVKASKEQFDYISNYVETSGKSFTELYDELGGWNLDNPDKYYDVDNYFDCYYESLLITVKAKDGKLSVSPKDVYVYPSDVTGEPSDELFHLDFDVPIDYTKIGKQVKAEGVNIDDVKDIDNRKFFNIVFQLDKLRSFEVNYEMRRVFKGAIGKQGSTFEPYKVVDTFTMNTTTLQKGKRDYQSIGYEDNVLQNHSIAKNFYDKWRVEHLHSLDENDYNELLQDVETLKNTYNYIEKPLTKPDDDVIRFSEIVELSKMQPKNKLGESEFIKTEAKSLNNEDVKNLLDNGNVVTVGGKQNYTPTDFYVDTNKIVWYKNGEISFGWEKHPSMNYEDLINHLDKMQKDGFTVEVSNVKPPKVEENKSLKTEGAGAGYELSGSIDDAKVNTFKIEGIEKNDYGERVVILSCDVDVKIADMTFSSYEYGGKLDFPINAKIVKMRMMDNDTYEEGEEPEINDYNVRDALNGTKFKTMLGGGWSHVTFTGEFNTDAEGNMYSSYFYTDNLDIVISDKHTVDFIDKKVSGELDEITYCVYDEDNDPIEDFKDKDEAIKYAKENGYDEVVERYHDYVLVDAEGSIDDNSYEEGNVVWSRTDESKSIKTESKSKKVEDVGINDYESVYVDQKEELSDGRYHMRLVCDGYKMWINVGQYKGNGVVQWDYDFDSPEYDVDAEDYINSSVDVNDIEEAILKAILTKKTEGDNPNVSKYIREYLESKQFYPGFVIVEDGKILVDIEWGDWKHDHLRCDDLMTDIGYTLVEEEVTEEDGSDCYSAIRHYIPKGSITNLDESVDTKIAQDRKSFIDKWKDHKDFKCSWCGTKFTGNIDDEGRMPNCPHCMEDRYAEDESKVEDGHANKDVHFCDSTTGDEIYTDYTGNIVTESKDITLDNVEDIYNNISDNLKNYLENTDNVPTKEIDGTLWFDITADEKAQLEKFIDYMDSIPDDIWRAWDEKTKLDMSSYVNNAERLCRNCTLKLESKEVKTESKYVNLDENKDIKLEKMTVDRPEFNSEYDKIKQELEDKLLNGATNDDIIEFYKEISDKVTDKEFSALVTFAGEIGLWVVKEFDTVDEMEKYLRDNHIKVMERQSKDGKIVIRYPKISGLQEDRHTVTNGPVTYIGFDDVNNGKVIIRDEGTYTYVIYQEDSSTQVIYHIKKIDDTKYAYGSFDYDGYTTSKESAIEEIINSIMKEYNLNNKPEIITENKSMKTEAPEKDGETYNKLCKEIQFQADENNIDITEEQVKKVADKICYEDRYFFSNSLPEDGEDWSEVNTYILQSIKTVLGLQEDYKSLDNQLDKLISKDATDKEFNDFLEKASNDDTITNNEYTELVKKAQDTRRINEGKSIKVERKDPEENFEIDEDLAYKCDGIHYKGIFTTYIEDTNTLLFTIDKGEDATYNDEDDIDTVVYRNQTPEEIKTYIDNLVTQRQNIIEETKDATSRYSIRDYANTRDLEDDESQYAIYDDVKDDFYYDEAGNNPVFDDIKLAQAYVDKLNAENKKIEAKLINESTEDDINIENIKDILVKSGISNERTLDLMSKDVLRTLKSNYADDCSADGIYYGVAITDAIQKVIERITGTKPKMKFGEGKSIKTESFKQLKDLTNIDEIYLEIAEGNSVIDVINKLRDNGLSSMTYDIEVRGDKNVKVIRTWFKEVEDTLADITTGKLSRAEYSDKYNDIYASQDTNKVIGWNYLDKLGKRYDGKYYEIVEDTYEYPNGLLLIVYDYDTNGEDVPENLDNVPEIDHICINLDDIEGSISDKDLDDLKTVLNEGKSLKESTEHFKSLDRLEIQNTLNELLKQRGINTDNVCFLVHKDNSDYEEYGGPEYEIALWEKDKELGYGYTQIEEFIQLTIRDDKDVDWVYNRLEELYKQIQNGDFDNYKAKSLKENATDDRFNSTLESWERLGYKLYKQESTITVLINDSKDMPIAIAFNGKASKPIWHYKFSNMDDLDSYVNKSIENAKAREQSKVDRKAQRKLTSEHDIKVGDIFYTSWGYDQTNTEFYEVVNVRGSRIDLKEIGYTVDYEKASYGREDITPVPHKFVNDEVHTVSARADGTVTDLDGKDFLNLYKYEGGSQEVTASGWGH